MLVQRGYDGLPKKRLFNYPGWVNMDRTVREIRERKKENNKSKEKR